MPAKLFVWYQDALNFLGGRGGAPGPALAPPRKNPRDAHVATRPLYTPVSLKSNQIFKKTLIYDSYFLDNGRRMYDFGMWWSFTGWSSITRQCMEMTTQVYIVLVTYIYSFYKKPKKKVLCTSDFISFYHWSDYVFSCK